MAKTLELEYQNCYDSIPWIETQLDPNLVLQSIWNFSQTQHLQLKLNQLDQLGKEICQKNQKLCAKIEIQTSINRVFYNISKFVTENNYTNFNDIKTNASAYRLFYKFLIFLWTSNEDMDIEAFIKIQDKQIELAKRELEKLKPSKPKLLTDQNTIELYLSNIKDKLKLSLHNIFEIKTLQDQIFDFKIEQNKNPKLQNVPGYYLENKRTFYYTLDENGIDPNSLDWIMIHEGIPGHHMQMVYESTISRRLPLKLNHFLPDFIEGWAAYVEDCGKSLNLYDTDAKHYYALKWKILRAARIKIDFMIHQEEATKSQAIEYIKTNFPMLSDVAEREVSRIISWPAQVFSYVYGKWNIEQARDTWLKQGKNLVEFHSAVLLGGMKPTNKLMKNSCDISNMS